MACKRISWPETVPENITKAVIGSNRERNVSSLFVGEEHCVTRQKRLQDSEGDYQVYKIILLYKFMKYYIGCCIYEILQLYNKSQIYELILLLQNVGKEFMKSFSSISKS